jgi:hypothetical protein
MLFGRRGLSEGKEAGERYLPVPDSCHWSPVMNPSELFDVRGVDVDQRGVVVNAPGVEQRSSSQGFGVVGLQP